KVRLGVTDSIALPVNLVWFPQDGASPRVPMDRCAPPTADASCVVPNGALIYDTTANFNTFEQLMRRVRAVELSVRTRSPRQDRDLIQRQGAGFRLDPDQLPLDGFTRRTTIFQNMPRNFSLAGNFVTP
ncbi:MAG TPA: hypothetical protein VEY30_00910, partial [Myxococcaceae bacterium]|nr:hypothetical protein [Myxococcaceae bacterium]